MTQHNFNRDITHTSFAWLFQKKFLIIDTFKFKSCSSIPCSHNYYSSIFDWKKNHVLLIPSKPKMILSHKNIENCTPSISKIYKDTISLYQSSNMKFVVSHYFYFQLVKYYYTNHYYISWYYYEGHIRKNKILFKIIGLEIYLYVCVCVVTVCVRVFFLLFH